MDQSQTAKVILPILPGKFKGKVKVGGKVIISIEWLSPFCPINVSLLRLKRVQF
jgi:hypothetical protein